MECSPTAAIIATSIWFVEVVVGVIGPVICIHPHTLVDSLGKNIVVTGNTIRTEILEKQNIPEFKTQLPMLYVTGGSAGAVAINEAIGSILPELLADYV